MRPTASWRAGADGPLLGIPYGAKDLLAARGAPTIWGSGAYRDQVFDYDAAAIEKLHAAGAPLIGKLALMELAGLHGGIHSSVHGPGLNPWDTSRWACGSSSGSGAAVAAGLTPFAPRLRDRRLDRLAVGVLRHHRPAPDVRPRLALRRDAARTVAGQGRADGPDRDGRRDRPRGDRRVRPARSRVGARPRRSGGRTSRRRPPGCGAGAGPGDWRSRRSTSRKAPTSRCDPCSGTRWPVRGARCRVRRGRAPARAAVLQDHRGSRVQRGHGNLPRADRERSAGSRHRRGPARKLRETLSMPAYVYLDAMRDRERVRAAFDAIFRDVDAILTYTLPWEPHPIVGEFTPVNPTQGFTGMVAASNLADLPALFLPVGLDGEPVAGRRATRRAEVLGGDAGRARRAVPGGDGLPRAATADGRRRAAARARGRVGGDRDGDDLPERGCGVPGRPASGRRVPAGRRQLRRLDRAGVTRAPSTTASRGRSRWPARPRRRWACSAGSAATTRPAPARPWSCTRPPIRASTRRRPTSRPASPTARGCCASTTSRGRRCGARSPPRTRYREARSCCRAGPGPLTRSCCS